METSAVVHVGLRRRLGKQGAKIGRGLLGAFHPREQVRRIAQRNRVTRRNGKRAPIGRERFIESIQLPQCRAQVDVRRSVFGAQARYDLEFHNGLGNSSLAVPQIRKRLVGGDKIGSERGRAFKLQRGVIEPPGRLPGETQLVNGGPGIGVDGQRAAQQLDGAGRIALLQLDCGEEVQCVEVPRVPGQYRFVAGDSGVQFTGAMVRHGLIEATRGALAVGIHQPAQYSSSPAMQCPAIPIQSKPRSAKEMTRLPATMKWSSVRMSTSASACFSATVSSSSAREGSATPLG